LRGVGYNGDDGLKAEPIPVKYQLISAGWVAILGAINVGIFQLYVRPYVESWIRDSNPTDAFLPSTVILLMIFFTVVLPTGFFAEFLSARYWQREFRPLNVLIGVAMTGPAFLVTASMLFVFHLLFRGLNGWWQISLLSVCGMAGLISFGIMGKNKRFRRFLEKREAK
jgi:hypothetical protein